MCIMLFYFVVYYMYASDLSGKSDPREFHDCVVQSLNTYMKCLSEHAERWCAYASLDSLLHYTRLSGMLITRMEELEDP